MDQNIQKALWLGVGVLLFVAIVSTGLMMFNKGRTLAETSNKELDKMTKELSEAGYEAYNNSEVAGSDVVNLIKSKSSESGDFIVQVTSNTGGTKTYISGGSVSNNTLSGSLSKKNRASIDQEIKNMIDSESLSYINPSGEFYSQLIYDKNEVIKGVVFVQQ